jgi:Mrp family chromosome partitioning ATPase
MSRPLPSTEASVRRAVSAARKAGLRVVGIRADGMVMVQDGDNCGLPLHYSAPIAEASERSSKWEDAEA